MCAEDCCHGNQQLKDNSAFVLITKEEGEKQKHGCGVRGEIGGGGGGWGGGGGSCKDAPLGRTQQVTCCP